MKPHRLDRTMGWRAGVAAGLTAGALLAAPSSGGAVAAAPTPDLSVATARYIVEGDGSHLGAVGQEAMHLGGRVVAAQRALGTMVVEVPAAAANRLRAVAGVSAVTADSKVTLQSTTASPTGLAGDMTNITRLTGATTFWENGFTGQGVDVALLDSGVLPVEGLTTANKLVIGPDLSVESRRPNLTHLDTFGHGTHMAGIIAGRDTAATSGSYAQDTTNFLGMAPDSRIVSIKLADARGRTDVSQVISALDWVVTHARSDGLNIRVVNLSFSSTPKNNHRLDPLVHAAEVAWTKGIVVVASAGNERKDDDDDEEQGLASPAYSPILLAVGALDTRGNDDDDDDDISTWSNHGDQRRGLRGPDLVAPGTSIVSLRAARSYLDTRFGSSAVVGDRFFKGSGTSQATAMVSGAAALLLSQRSELTPDQVRDILRRSARALPNSSVDASGAGTLDLRTAYATPAAAVPGATSQSRLTPRYAQRGQCRIVRGTRAAVVEQVCGGWTGATWAGATWAGNRWTGATWAGATWAGATWAGATWAGATWAGNGWTGATWAGATWAGATWAGTKWE